MADEGFPMARTEMVAAKADFYKNMSILYDFAIADDADKVDVEELCRSAHQAYLDIDDEGDNSLCEKACLEQAIKELEIEGMEVGQ